MAESANGQQSVLNKLKDKLGHRAVHKDGRDLDAEDSGEHKLDPPQGSRAFSVLAVVRQGGWDCSLGEREH